jgi:hypothetical protein
VQDRDRPGADHWGVIATNRASLPAFGSVSGTGWARNGEVFDHRLGKDLRLWTGFGEWWRLHLARR